MTAKEKKQARKNKRNARIARCRFLKNLLIWFIGVLFLPSIIAVGVFLVPISVYMGGQDTSDAVNTELTNKSIFGVLTSIGDYTFNDLPFVISLVESIEGTEISEGNTLGDFVEIDYAKLKTLKLGSSTFTEDLGSCFKVVATMNSVGVSGLLGDLDIEAFSAFTAVKDADRPSLDGNGYIEKDENDILTANPKLYYYKVSDVGSNAPYSVLNGETYERAFTDDGKLLVPEDIMLYYVPLFEAPILDALDLIDEILGNLEVTELLAVAGVELPEEEGEESIIEKLLGGKTISELGTLGLDGIYIYDVLGGDATDLIYTVLSQATGKAVEEITFEHLTDGLTVDNILLSTFIGEAEGEIDVLEILSQIVEVDEGEPPTAETLNVGHLSNINPSKLSIGKILPYKEYEDGVLTKDNSEIYKILLSSIAIDGVSKLPAKIEGETDEDYDLRVQIASESLMVDDFSSIKINNLSLSTVLPIKEYDDKGNVTKDNTELYDILCKAVVVEEGEQKPTPETLNIGHLTSGLDINTIPISQFIEDTDSEIFKVLCDAVVVGANEQKPTAETLNIGHLSNINLDGVALSTVLPIKEYNDQNEVIKDNTELYQILCDAVVVGVGEQKPTAETLNIGHLSGLNIDNVPISQFIEDTESDMFKILCDAVVVGVGEQRPTAETLNIGHLANLDMEKVALSKVLPYKEYEDDVLTKDNSEIYKIILSSIVENGECKLPTQNVGETDEAYDLRVKAAAESLTISDFSNIEPNSIKIAEIMTSPNPTFVEILEYTTDKKYDEITVGELAELNPDGIALSIFIDAPADIDDPNTTIDETQVNKKLYDILLQTLVIKDEDGKIIDNPTPSDVRLEHLNDFNTETILLNSVMPKTDANSALYDILKDVTGKDYTEVTVGDLGTFTTASVSLKIVLPYKEYEEGVLTKDNSKLYKIILSAIVENGVSKLPVQNAGETDEDYELRVQAAAESLTVDDFSKVKPDLMKISVIMTSPNPTFVEILEYTTGKDYNEITVGELETLNPDRIALSIFIDAPADVDDPNTTIDETQVNKTLYDILLQSLVIKNENGEVITSPAYKDIKLNHLNNFNVDKILLNTVMPKTSANAKLYDILKDITGKDYTAVSLEDLKTFNTDKILLNTVMPKTGANDKLYDILKDITGKDYTAVSLEDLKNFNTDNILLNTVMPKTSGNVKLYDILKDITGKDYTEVSLYDLKVFKTEKILLNTVMPKTSANTKLYDILKDITGKDYTEVSLGDLESFNTDNILLNTVVPYDAEKNGKLYAVLKDVTGYDYTGVKISMLQNFDPLKIKLETVLEKGDNNILNALLDKGGTLGTMDENVSTLTLYEVYKETCFTTDEKYTNDLSKKYKLSVVDGKDVYTLDADGEYYLNVNAGVWLIMCFDGNAKETADGVSTVFTESALTLGDMQASGNKLNERIQNATIRELISAGIMPNVEFSNEEIYHMTFEEFIELASSML